MDMARRNHDSFLDPTNGLITNNRVELEPIPSTFSEQLFRQFLLPKSSNLNCNHKKAFLQKKLPIKCWRNRLAVCINNIAVVKEGIAIKKNTEHM